MSAHQNELLRGVSALGDGTFVRVCTQPVRESKRVHWNADMDNTCGRLGIVAGGDGAGGVSAVVFDFPGHHSLYAYENAWLTPVARDVVSASEAHGLRAATVRFLIECTTNTRHGLDDMLRGVPGLAEACGLGARRAQAAGERTAHSEAPRLSMLELSVRTMMEHNLQLLRRVGELERRVAVLEPSRTSKCAWPSNASSMENVD